jgi:hypothetical protein
LMVRCCWLMGGRSPLPMWARPMGCRSSTSMERRAAGSTSHGWNPSLPPRAYASCPRTGRGMAARLRALAVRCRTGLRTWPRSPITSALTDSRSWDSRRAGRMSPPAPRCSAIASLLLRWSRVSATWAGARRTTNSPTLTRRRSCRSGTRTRHWPGVKTASALTALDSSTPARPVTA